MLAAIVGIIIGAVLGLTGAGGSIFAVPLLILLLGLPPNEAIGLSLGAVFLTSFIGVVIHYKHGSILWVPAAIFAAGGFIAAPLGRYSSHFFDDQFILIAFSVVAIFVAMRMWYQAGNSPQDSAIVRAAKPSGAAEQDGMACQFSPTGQFMLKLPCVSLLIVAGLVTGWFAGFFGVGGGFIIVPILIAISSLPMIKAVGTSLVIILITALSGFASHVVFTGFSDWQLLMQIALGGVVGMLLGSTFATRIAGPKLARVFSCLVVALVVTTLWR